MSNVAPSIAVPDLGSSALIDGAGLLNDVKAAVRAYCVLPDDNAYTAVTLWVAFTHCVNAFDYAPAWLSEVHSNVQARLGCWR